MKQFKICLLVISTTFTIGCSQTMPEEYYPFIAENWYHTNKCYKEGKISPELFINYKMAYRYALSGWTYDPQKLNKYIFSLSNTKNTTYTCNDAILDAYDMISKAEKSKQEQAQTMQNWNDFNNQINANRTIYCHQIGTMTICN